ncbi:MAG: hypothetical protein KA314_06710 [Chloroflexi bacterium]|nr:hypothetical protein [Chloroflexota bacterium]MBP8055516.1 hypothetical protein [Chloroflexota bacterium]
MSAQLVFILFSLAVGAFAIYELSSVFERLGQQVVKDSHVKFIALSIMPFLFYSILILGTASVETIASPPDTFSPPEGIMYLGVIGIVPGFFTLCLFLESNFWLLVLYHLVQTILLSFISILIRYIVLKLYSFDREKYRWLITSEANLYACKAGVLPFREKISAIWIMVIGIGVVSFLLISTFSGLLSLVKGYTDQPILYCFVFPILVILFASVVASRWKNLQATHFSTVEGKITKSKIVGRRKSIVVYRVQCEDREYEIGGYLWVDMADRSWYRLWLWTEYRKTKVIAFEKIPAQNLEGQPISNNREIKAFPDPAKLKRSKDSKRLKS